MAGRRPTGLRLRRREFGARLALVHRAVYDDEPERDPADRRRLPAILASRVRITVGASRCTPPIPNDRYEVAKGPIDAVVLLVIATPYDDAGHA